MNDENDDEEDDDDGDDDEEEEEERVGKGGGFPCIGDNLHALIMSPPCTDEPPSSSLTVFCLADTTTGKFTLLSAKVPDEMLVSEVPASAAIDAALEWRGITMALHLSSIICSIGEVIVPRLQAHLRTLNYAFICLVGFISIGWGPCPPWRSSQRGSAPTNACTTKTPRLPSGLRGLGQSTACLAWWGLSPLLQHPLPLFVLFLSAFRRRVVAKQLLLVAPYIRSSCVLLGPSDLLCVAMVSAITDACLLDDDVPAGRAGCPEGHGGDGPPAIRCPPGHRARA